MPATAFCPDVQIWQDFLLGILPPLEVEKLGEHLHGCQVCAGTIDSLRKEDTLVEAMRAARDTHADPPEVELLINQLSKLTEREEAAIIPPSAAPPPEATVGNYAFLAPPQAADEMGRLGGYRVFKVLGVGGMGVVFWAEDPNLERQVALKVMKPTWAAIPSARQRFVREAKACAALRSDHVVTIYQVGEDRGVTFLAMEFLEGLPLDKWLDGGKKATLAEALRFGREIAQGLDAAHAKGLIHRDIKPANLWLDAHANRIKILDFGLARVTDDDVQLTQSGTILGSPAYMAPEQARADPVDARTDLFSLGCVLYRLLTGRLPFKGKDTMSTLLALATTVPEAPHVLQPEVPNEVSELIMRLMAKEPNERPASARAVVEALANLERTVQGIRVDRPRQAGKAPAKKTAPVPAKSSEDKTVAVSFEKKPARKETKAQPPPQPPRSRRGLWIGVAVAVLALLPLGYFFGGTVFRLATNKGELVVEVDDPNVEIVVKQGGVVVQDKTSKRELVVSAGDGEVEVYEKGSDLKIATERFKLTRGGKEVVRVRLETAAAKAPAASTPGDDRKAAEWVLSIGGKTTVQVSEKQMTIEAAGELPVADFQLHEVYLSSNQKVTDTGLKHLHSLGNLRVLDLANTATSDAAIVHFRGLDNLSALGLQGTKVTDRGLADLATLAKLEKLDMSDTPVTDAGIAHLKALSGLTYIALNSTQLGDRGLEVLQRLPKLTTLQLEKTKVTAQGVAVLQKALPQCKILGDFTNPSPLADKDKPFLLLRKDGQKQEYKHFAEVLTTLQDGDRIEVHGNGPFPTPRVRVGLDMRAAPGYRPLFVPLGNIKGNGPNSWFVEGGLLRLEGCDFRWEGADFFYRGAESPLELCNCRFLNQGGSLGATGALKTKISNCLVLSGGLSFVSPKAEVDASNNIFISFLGLAENGQKTRLTRNTFAGGPIARNPAATSKVEVEANGNAIGVLSWSVRELSSFDAEGMVKIVQWRGGDNLYSFSPLGVNKALPVLRKEMGSEEKGSHEVRQIDMHLDRFRKADAEKGVAMLRPIVEAAQKKHKLAELGPQWDLVGPGEAYVKALAAAGRKVPADQLRPSAPASGVFVILRKDKEPQGYLSLEDALSAAEDGDTVEIRTDGPFQGALLAPQARVLTIRSAPGYRPVLDGNLNIGGKDRFTIEGLHFRKGAIASHGAASHVVRVANCAFEDREATNFGLHAEENQPATIINCWFPASHGWHLDSGNKLIVRNSVLGNVQLGAGQCDFDRCVFISPSGYALSSDKGALSAKGSLFFAGPDLMRGLPDQWTGTGNVYACGQVGVLRELRERYKSPETGSVEDFPLLWNPQEWRIAPGQFDGKSFGADVDKIAK